MCYWKKNIYVYYNKDKNKVCIKPCSFSSKDLLEYSINEFNQVSFSNIKQKLNSLKEDKENCFFIKGKCVHETNIESVEVSLFYQCNLNCNFCWVQNERQYIKENLNSVYFNFLYKMLDENLETLRLTDRGEPLLPFNDTLKFIQRIKTKKIKNLNITTNGILLNSIFFSNIKSVYEKIHISVSLNAFSKQKYYDYTGKDTFEIVINNIRLLKDFYLKNKNFKIPKVTFIISHSNLNDTLENINSVLKLIDGFTVDFVYDCLLKDRNTIENKKLIDFLISNVRSPIYHYHEVLFKDNEYSTI